MRCDTSEVWCNYLISNLLSHLIHLHLAILTGLEISLSGESRSVSIPKWIFFRNKIYYWICGQNFNNENAWILTLMLLKSSDVVVWVYSTYADTGNAFYKRCIPGNGNRRRLLVYRGILERKVERKWILSIILKTYFFMKWCTWLHSICFQLSLSTKDNKQ